MSLRCCDGTAPGNSGPDYSNPKLEGSKGFAVYGQFRTLMSSPRRPLYWSIGGLTVNNIDCHAGVLEFREELRTLFSTSRWKIHFFSRLSSCRVRAETSSSSSCSSATCCTRTRLRSLSRDVEAKSWMTSNVRPKITRRNNAEGG